MNTDDRERLNGLSSQIIGSARKVSSILGCGLLEKVYENALAVELRNRGLQVVQQSSFTVCYAQKTVGEYFADLLVEGRIVVELKAVKFLIRFTRHSASTIYARAGCPYAF